MIDAKTVLLVDDDADDAHLFQEALNEADPAAVYYWASGGKVALDKLSNGEVSTPRLIFLDINMPQMNGWELLSHLRAHPVYQSVPVIMYSTSSHPTEVKRALTLGAVGFCVKPDDYEHLKKMLSQLVGSWEVHVPEKMVEALAHYQRLHPRTFFLADIG